MKKIFLLVAAMALVAGGCPTNPDGTGEVDYEDDVKPLIEEIDEEYKVRGSCNVIAEKSTCVDYVGSFWNDQQIDLNCGGAGTYSTNTCPYSDRGGCVSAPGTMTEMVIWSYGHGGQPISVEEAGYQAQACNALPVSNWVGPDYFLNGE